MKNIIYEKDIDVESTHIHLKTDCVENNIIPVIEKNRKIIQDCLLKNKEFGLYEPIDVIEKPKILNLMTKAAIVSNTGPMASVAGSINEMCIEYLEKFDTKYSVVENGGDIAFKTNKNLVVGVFAGKSIYSKSIGFIIKAKPNSYSVCTSSGTYGHSENFGISDATIVFAKKCSVSDSLATSIGNYAKGNTDNDVVENALSHADDFREFLDGCIVIKRDVLGKVGKIPKIVKTNKMKRLSEKYDVI